MEGTALWPIPHVPCSAEAQRFSPVDAWCLRLGWLPGSQVLGCARPICCSQTGWGASGWHSLIWKGSEDANRGWDSRPSFPVPDCWLWDHHEHAVLCHLLAGHQPRVPGEGAAGDRWVLCKTCEYDVLLWGFVQEARQCKCINTRDGLETLCHGECRTFKKYFTLLKSTTCFQALKLYISIFFLLYKCFYCFCGQFYLLVFVGA